MHEKETKTVARPILCVNCGRGGGTLRRVRSANGKKVNPAKYEHWPLCPPAPPKPLVVDKSKVLSKAEVLAARVPVEEV